MKEISADVDFLKIFGGAIKITNYKKMPKELTPCKPTFIEKRNKIIIIHANEIGESTIKVTRI